MTATTAERNTKRYELDLDDGFNEYPVAAATKVLAGTIVVLDGQYAKPGTTATGRVCVGRARRTADNTAGAAGAIRVQVDAGCFAWENSAGGDEITAADIGGDCFLVDNQTVALSPGGGTRSLAGRVVAVDGGKPVVAMGLNGSVSPAALLELFEAPPIRAGTGTLVAGTATITGTLTGTSRIIVTRNTAGGTIGDLRAPSASRVPGQGGAGSFVVNASVNTDTSTFDYLVIG